MSIRDTIERTVLIGAPVAQVWDLISVPGWWINDGVGIDFAAEPGAYDVEVLSADPPHSICFRWRVSGVEGASATADQFLHTLVTFTVTEVEEGTRVRVVESGFAAAAMDELARARAYRDNDEGWEIELSLARAHAEAATTSHA